MEIKIGCNKWTLELHDFVTCGGVDCRGLCLCEDRTIKLKSSLENTRLMGTFLHECIHAIDDEYDVDLTEHQVHLLGTSLLSLIRDNKINFLADEVGE